VGTVVRRLFRPTDDDQHDDDRHDGYAHKEETNRREDEQFEEAKSDHELYPPWKRTNELLSYVGVNFVSTLPEGE
jgi:hypothetical protein